MRYPPCSENGNPVLSAPISAPFGSSSHMHPPTAPSQTPYPFGSYTWQRPAGHHPQQKYSSRLSLCAKDSRSSPKSSQSPIASPYRQSSNIHPTAPSQNPGQQYSMSSPSEDCACIGGGPACISSLWPAPSTFGECKTQPESNGAGCRSLAGSHFTTIKLIESSSAIPSVTTWTPGERTLSHVKGVTSPGMLPSSQGARGNSNVQWRTSCDTKSWLKCDGMGGKSWAQRCSSYWEEHCPPSSGGEGGIPHINPDATPMPHPHGAYLTESSSRTPWLPPTAPCAIWNGGLYDYPNYGRVIRLPSHARLPSVHHSSWNSLMQPHTNPRPQAARATRHRPSVSPPIPIDRMCSLSAQSRRRWRNQNRWRHHQRQIMQSTMELLHHPLPVSHWRHALQLLLVGVQAWVLLLALWLRRLYHLHKYQMGFIMAALAVWRAVWEPCDLQGPSANPQQNVLCVGINPLRIPHHTMAMSSPRLGAGMHMHIGDLCGCAKLHRSPCSICHIPIQQHLQRSAELIAQKLKVSVTNVTMLLRDLIVLMVNRLPVDPPPNPPSPSVTPPPSPNHSPQPPPEPPPSPLAPVHQLLHQLATDPSVISDTSPTARPNHSTDTSPTEGTPSQASVTPDMVQRGLGDAGHVDIPQPLWQSCAPANYTWATEQAPPQCHSHDPLLLMLASKLEASGLLCECPPHLRPNAKAYLKPKSAQKCALIVNMIPINDRCLPPPPFTLPSLDSLAHVITVALLRGRPLYFTKLDISNMFWSCKVPAEHRHAVRIGVCGKVFSFPGLPFGWNASPAIAQQLLALYIQQLYPGETVVIQYMDDILVVGPDKQHVQHQTDHLIHQFQTHRWVVSAKSDVDPKHTVTWMGKHFDGLRGVVATGTQYLVGVVVLWIKLGTRGYQSTLLQRLLGKLQWALRPGRGAAAFLAGPYAWLQQGPPVAKCTPPAVLRALAEAAAAAIVPWTAPVTPPERHLEQSLTSIRCPLPVMPVVGHPMSGRCRCPLLGACCRRWALRFQGHPSQFHCSHEETSSDVGGCVGAWVGRNEPPSCATKGWPRLHCSQ